MPCADIDIVGALSQLESSETGEPEGACRRSSEVTRTDAMDSPVSQYSRNMVTQSWLDPPKEGAILRRRSHFTFPSDLHLFSGIRLLPG